MFDFLGVIVDLGADGSRMVLKVGLLLFVNLTFVFFSSLVLLDDTEEGVTLELGLLAEHLLALHELDFACNV